MHAKRRAGQHDRRRNDKITGTTVNKTTLLALFEETCIGMRWEIAAAYELKAPDTARTT